MKKYKKAIIIALCSGLVISAFSPITTGFASEMAQKVQKTFGGKPASDSSIVSHVSSVASPTEEAISTQISSDPPAKNESFLRQRIGQTEADKYNFKSNDIQELFKQGYSIDDLIRADALANDWDIDPKKILKDKREKGLDWKQVDENIQKEKLSETIQKYKNKHAHEIKQLDEADVPLQDQIALLSLLEKRIAPPVEQIIQQYKKDGAQIIGKYIQENKIYENHSKPQQFMNKHKLSEAEIQGFSEEDLDKLEKVSKDNNVELKELIKNIRTNEKRLKNKEVKP
ncbi:hypothetical protein [Paenibacillus thalictri]|uniref:Uncharacterized protein n=1 Tax=Paenibacillus thalictri TaxID=2527873 RepID=A0A4Q9DHQ3_9BACL|nr:hypothetical protein [Paenibacillus thalictri]TBL69887.1 hypothetical protein EYB31_34480 [Paenibacillus thalictri]